MESGENPTDRVTFTAMNESDTDRFGAALARILPDGTVIAMTGTLGAGKTRLVRAVAQASGIDPEEVSSPTFVLVHEYLGKRPIYHFDTYRLRDEDEFMELGPEEYFYGAGLTFVEWAERFPAILPEDRIEIVIDVLDETVRRFTLIARGTCYADIPAKLMVQPDK